MPVLEGAGIAFGREGQLPVVLVGFAAGAGWGITLPLIRVHRPEGFTAQAVVGHPDVPLVAEVGLDGDVRSITVSDGVLVVADGAPAGPRS